MTVVRIGVAGRAERHSCVKLSEVFPAEFHHLTSVTVFAFHAVPADGAGRAVPLFVHFGRVTQPTQHTLSTIDVITEDVAEGL